MAKNRDEDLLNDAIPMDELEIIDDDDDPLLADAISIDELEIVEDTPPVKRGSLDVDEIELAEDDDDEDVNKEIITFDKNRVDEDAKKWNRTPDPDGKGAIRCRSFVAKLRMDAVEHMDEQINDWLDAHPNYSVKHVSSTVGVLKGKEKEDALFLTLFF